MPVTPNRSPRPGMGMGGPQVNLAAAALEVKLKPVAKKENPVPSVVATETLDTKPNLKVELPPPVSDDDKGYQPTPRPDPVPRNK